MQKNFQNHPIYTNQKVEIDIQTDMVQKVRQLHNWMED